MGDPAARNLSSNVHFIHSNEGYFASSQNEGCRGLMKDLSWRGIQVDSVLDSPMIIITNLWMSFADLCNPRCTNQGRCVNGTCVCTSAFSGRYCQIGMSILPLYNKTPLYRIARGRKFQKNRNPFKLSMKFDYLDQEMCPIYPKSDIYVSVIS